MPALIADMFLSVDGYARGSRSPGDFGFAGRELERWISEEMNRRIGRLWAGGPTRPRRRSPRRLATRDGMHGTDAHRRLLTDPREVSWPGGTINGIEVVDEVLRMKV
jgi:hypothetical protein